MAAHSIFLKPFVDEIVRTRGRSRDDVEGELLEAARRAARDHFGDATPVEVSLDDALGEVRLHQRLVVVDAVREAHTEISQLAVRRVQPTAAVGDVLRVPIVYTASRDALDAVAPWEGLTPLPPRDEAFWDALNARLSEAVQRYFPPRRHEPGTLGHLLQSGGDWVRGQTGRCGEAEVTIDRAFLRITSLTPTHAWADYGFVLRVRAGGDVSEHVFARGDNEGTLEAWAALPTDPSASDDLRSALEALAEEIAASPAEARDADLADAVNGHTWVSVLLREMVRRPAPGSLLEWARRALPAALGDYDCRVPREAGAVTFRVIRVFPPETGLGDFGLASLRLVAEVEGAEPLFDDADAGDVLPLGCFTPASLHLPGPATPEQVRDIERILAVHREWLDVHLAARAERLGPDPCDAHDLFYGFPGHFPLVQLIEQRLALGPPGSPPVPPFDDQALARAARALRPVQGPSLSAALAALRASEEREVFAVFEANGWRIALADELAGPPFGRPEILLLPPEGGPPVAVMMVDAWNPQTRNVVDGDAFAFRRFLTWLREGIRRGGHDATVRFEMMEVAFDDDDALLDDLDDEVLHDHEDESLDDALLRDPDPAVDDVLLVSDWLLFDLPDTGDRFLVDWRAQWHVVGGTGRIEDFAGLYGFSGEVLERLRVRDIPLWRRFLREVIDPRFDRTPGARLASPG